MSSSSSSQHSLSSCPSPAFFSVLLSLTVSTRLAARNLLFLLLLLLLSDTVLLRTILVGAALLSSSLALSAHAATRVCCDSLLLLLLLLFSPLSSPLHCVVLSRDACANGESETAVAIADVSMVSSPASSVGVACKYLHLFSRLNRQVTPRRHGVCDW